MKKIFILLSVVYLSLCFACTQAKPIESVSRETQEFAREYSASHLKRHPKQRVQNILVRFATVHSSESIDADVTLYVKYRNLPKWYSQVASCEKEKTKLLYSCYVDGDAGNFTIDLRVRNQLTLVGEARIDMCGIVWEDVATEIENAASTLNEENDRNLREIFVLGKVEVIEFRNILRNTNCGVE